MDKYGAYVKKGVKSRGTKEGADHDCDKCDLPIAKGEKHVVATSNQYEYRDSHGSGYRKTMRFHETPECFPKWLEEACYDDRAWETLQEVKEYGEDVMTEVWQRGSIKPFEARYDGWCAECRLKIYTGDDIVKPPGKDKYVHDRCWKGIRTLREEARDPTFNLERHYPKEAQ